mgnify:CR=1 FL=1
MPAGWKHSSTVAIGAMALSLASPLAAQEAAAPQATFDFVEYEAQGDTPPAPEGYFRNPVLPGFQPDPSIVRVGDDFYAVNSTFVWFPGLPIYHSRDLVHWKQIGNAIDRPDQMDFSGLATDRGLFAPAISYHDGRFWIVNTCIECGDNFVITAEHPEGPWSDPIYVSSHGFDPSLFHDDDGRKWFLVLQWNHISDSIGGAPESLAECEDSMDLDLLACQ